MAEETTHREQYTYTSTGSTGRKVAVFIVILIAGGLAGYLWLHNKNNKQVTQTTQITQPGNSNQDNQAALNPQIGNAAFDQAPAQTPSPAPIAITPAPKPAPKPVPVPVAIHYSNDAWHLAGTLPAGWAVAEGQIPHEIFFADTNKKSTLSSIESYDNRTHETLDSLERIVSGSPSTTNVQRTTIQGIPAISYTSTELSGTQIAFIYKDRIYYIHNITILSYVHLI